jgi:integrase
MGVSHQRGWVRLRGRKWHGNFRRSELDPETNEAKLVTHSFVLGRKVELTKTEARERLEDEIAKLGGRAIGDEAVVNGAVTFAWFVKNRYLPVKEGDWREETAKSKKYLIQADLIDTFGEYRLENFDKVILQTHLNQLAKTRSRDRVLQIRAYTRDIFAEAVDQGFLPKDPARKLKPPANLREVDKTTLTWDQLREALEKLSSMSLRDWILMKLEMSNALRPSELFPLRWRCFLEAETTLNIQETLYKGKIRPYGKTKGSMTKVPIARALAEEIVEYREQCREECRTKNKSLSNDAFMFPGRFGGPMDTGNYRKRVLHRLAKELGFPKLTFQVIRRTIATLGKSKAHPKDIQGLMRHSRLATTMEVYMQSLEPEVRQAINSIHDELTGTGTSGPRARPPAVPEARGAVRINQSENGLAARALQRAQEGKEEKIVPSRCKIIPFAGKMRAKFSEPIR